jgi:hypothetical protein
MDNSRPDNNPSEADKEQFKKYLDDVVKEVKQWPIWKQNVLNNGQHSAVMHIVDNLNTQDEWGLGDYRDFYNRDVVETLLPELITALGNQKQAELRSALAQLRHMYSVGSLSNHDKGLARDAIEKIEKVADGYDKMRAKLKINQEGEELLTMDWVEKVLPANRQTELRHGKIKYARYHSSIASLEWSMWPDGASIVAVLVCRTGHSSHHGERR